MIPSSDILELIRSQATDRYKSRGLALRRAGRVQLVLISADTCRFMVHCEETYSTKIAVIEDKAIGEAISIECTCPNFIANRDFCEHLVASGYALQEHLLELETATRDNQTKPSIDDAAQWLYGPGIRSPKASEISTHNQIPVMRPDPDAIRFKHVLESMTRLQQYAPPHQKPQAPSAEKDRIEIWYELKLDRLKKSGAVSVQTYRKTLRPKTGKISKLQKFSWSLDAPNFEMFNFIHSADLNILRRFTAVVPRSPYEWASISSHSATNEIDFGRSESFRELSILIETGRCFVAPDHSSQRIPSEQHIKPLRVASNEIFKCHIEVKPIRPTKRDKTSDYTINASLKNSSGRSIPIASVSLFDNTPFLLTSDFELVAFERPKSEIFQLLKSLSKLGPIKGPTKPVLEFIKVVEPVLTEEQIHLPEALHTTRYYPPFKPRLALLKTSEAVSPQMVFCNFAFDYDGTVFNSDDKTKSWLTNEQEQRHLSYRSLQKEAQTIDTLAKRCPSIILPAVDHNFQLGHSAEIARDQVTSAVIQAIECGWLVLFDGKLLRKADNFSMAVSSGIDWFDVNCEARFGGQTLRGLELLTANGTIDGFVQLADGSLGLIDDKAFQQRLRLLKRFVRSSTDCDGVRISKLHAVLLELEGERGQISYDSEARQFYKNVRSYSEIKPTKPSSTFKADLRPYQLEGLAWLNYLEKCGFGGCLADDMGLGKTIQVLSMLDRYYKDSESSRKMPASLVISPKSLIYNWLAESQKFAPDLKVLVLDKPAGVSLKTIAAKHDVIIASYQTIRGDLEDAAKVDFEYVILDEAHYIKNSASQISRATKLLKARHRLALTGTPIENRLDDLASIFEFLNPHLGGLSLFRKSANGLNGTSEDRTLLAQVLRPFLLRRTKDQVLKDLPSKNESIIYCDLGEKERFNYDSLAKTVREKLVSEIKTNGIKKAQIHILAGLTKLRQASCHVGLVDKKLKSEPSTKLDILLDRVKETVSRGEKALVFSQFIELLELAKEQLSEAGISYTYLDGQTRNRQELVDKFNSTHGESVFLISLKAGGVGLNLTAASNCFLLDPWWNPAAEAQAIDRAHRIGQTKPVFAYRLISRGTVEEKILRLQATKKDLADSILTPGAGSPRALTMSDLEVLLN
jgi:superfamily II DNA or RNA helicase